MRADALGRGRSTEEELIKSLAAIVADIFVNRHNAPEDNAGKSTPASYNEADQHCIISD